jgi:hypothetical protein
LPTAGLQPSRATGLTQPRLAPWAEYAETLSCLGGYRPRGNGFETNKGPTVRATVIAVLLCFATTATPSATGQNKPPPPQTDLGFDASKVPPPDPKKVQPVARVLDQYIYPDQIRSGAPVSDKDKLLYLQYFIIGPLFDRLKEREKIAATPEELAQLEAFLKKRKIDRVPALTHLWFFRLRSGNKAPGQDRIDAIVLWKTEGELFKRYGGVVAVSKFRSPIPVDAYRRFLEDAEGTRAFEILDPKLHDAFFKQLSEKPRFTVPPAKIDFETPWWVTAGADVPK